MIAHFIDIFSLAKVLARQHSFPTVTELVFSITAVLSNFLVKEDRTDGRYAWKASNAI